MMCDFYICSVTFSALIYMNKEENPDALIVSNSVNITIRLKNPHEY